MWVGSLFKKISLFITDKHTIVFVKDIFSLKRLNKLQSQGFIVYFQIFMLLFEYIDISSSSA